MFYTPLGESFELENEWSLPIHSAVSFSYTPTPSTRAREGLCLPSELMDGGTLAPSLWVICRGLFGTKQNG